MIPAGEVDGEEDGIEGVAGERGEGGFGGMGAEAEEARLPLFLRANEDLHRPAQCEDLLDLLDCREPVYLIEVEVIGAQRAPQRFRQFFCGLHGGSFDGLAGEEAVLAVRCERGAEALLGVAVGGRDVEIVDPRATASATIRSASLWDGPETMRPPRPSRESSAPVRPKGRRNMGDFS